MNVRSFSYLPVAAAAFLSFVGAASSAPAQSPSPDIECFDLQADSIGAPVSGYLARPVGAQPKSLPIILSVHGAGVQSSSLAGAVSWAHEGMLALDINAHGLPNAILSHVEEMKRSAPR
jgi:cephalosporin-C deacetylase-like acetyl esterase